MNRWWSGRIERVESQALQDTACLGPSLLTPRGFGVETAELNLFADAPDEHGYGTVSCPSFVEWEESIHNSCFEGKSVLRPLRSSIIVSMMELTVATVLIKVNTLIMKELAGRIEIYLPSSACLMRALRKKFFWECFNWKIRHVGEVKMSSGLANLSRKHAGATVKGTSGIGCLIGKTVGEDTPSFIVRIRRNREKNREECSESGVKNQNQPLRSCPG